MMKLNVYIGVMGSGKDYEADKCDEKISFGDAVRRDVWKILKWKPKTQEEYEMFKETKWKLPGDRIHYFTGRRILQDYGTDIRRTEDKDHWVKQLITKIDAVNNTNLALEVHERKYLTVGIPDCRFPNEVSGIINLWEKLATTPKRFELEFIHCDYKSNRYNAEDPHESESMAQEFAGKVYKTGEFFMKILKLHYTQWEQK